MMYETMYDILRDWQIHNVLLLILLFFGLATVVCAYLAMHFVNYCYNKKSSKAAACLSVSCLAVVLADGLVLQFYPDSTRAKALMEELALRKGIDAAPYIKIIEG